MIWPPAGLWSWCGSKEERRLEPASGLPTAAAPTVGRSDWEVRTTMDVIGIDPHKGSRTAAVLDRDEGFRTTRHVGSPSRQGTAVVQSTGRTLVRIAGAGTVQVESRRGRRWSRVPGVRAVPDGASARRAGLDPDGDGQDLRVGRRRRPRGRYQRSGRHLAPAVCTCVPGWRGAPPSGGAPPTSGS
jgi:hypothetical protein